MPLYLSKGEVPLITSKMELRCSMKKKKLYDHGSGFALCVSSSRRLYLIAKSIAAGVLQAWNSHILSFIFSENITQHHTTTSLF